MSGTTVKKKLRVAKKAWRKFSKTLQSKFKTAKRNLSSTFQQSLRLLIPSKLRPQLRTSKSSVPNSYYHHEIERDRYLQQHNHNRLQSQHDCRAIHIDELFSDRPAASTSAKSKAKEVEKEICSIEDAWNVVVASSPHLRPVDERAEEFISKFRKDIMLQKERSLLEFENMLARSA